MSAALYYRPVINMKDLAEIWSEIEKQEKHFRYIVW